MIDVRTYPSAEPLLGETNDDASRPRLATDLAALLQGTERAEPALELPSLEELTLGVLALADGTRRKVLVPVATAPIEYALVRVGEDVLVSAYETGSAPRVVALDRRVSLGGMLDACARAARDAASAATAAMRDAALELAERTERASIVPDAHPETAVVERSGGSIESPGDDVPLAFGFVAWLAPCVDPVPEPCSRADLHALLFEGKLWAFTRGRRIHLATGPIVLAVQRMIVAVRALVDAWEAGRAVNVRLRSGPFIVGTRADRSGSVAMTLGCGDDGTVTIPALDTPSAALPVLRVASDLVRALVSVDRTHARNLRLVALRDEVRALRRVVRARTRIDGFVNEDPDRLRLAPSVSEATTASGSLERPARETPQPVAASRLRFGERWRAEIEGLDSGSTFLCGDRLVVSTPRRVLALARDGGEVLWSRSVMRAASVMAKTTLLRLAPDGSLALWDVLEGDVYATTRVTPRVGNAPLGVFAGGGSLPPLAVLAEAHSRLVAIDLRNGEHRWRFDSRGGGAFRLRRAGRILLVACGDGALHAIDVGSGEVVWRFSERVRFCMGPTVTRDVCIAVSGEPGASSSSLFGIDLYSGRLAWRRELDAGALSPPLSLGDVSALAVGTHRDASLVAFDPSDGALRWMASDPGIGRGGAPLFVDDALVVNAPGGRVSCIELGSGEIRWRRDLSHPVTDDVPRRLEPILRGGALFVPSSTVHVLRPSDGAPIGGADLCDLIPDSLRVDERGWLYVVEDSGHLRVYAPAPQLRLVR